MLGNLVTQRALNDLEAIRDGAVLLDAALVCQDDGNAFSVELWAPGSPDHL